MRYEDGMLIVRVTMQYLSLPSKIDLKNRIYIEIIIGEIQMRTARQRVVCL
jgi:hypothetical protein